MATSGKWETVVNKKKSHITKSDVKRVQQKFVDGETAPKIDIRDPLKLDQTIYAAAFDAKPKKLSGSDGEEEKYPSRVPFEQVKSENSSTRSPKVSSRKRDKKVQKPIFNMESKIHKLDAAELKSLISEMQDKFPSHDLLCLKDVAAWLRLQLTGPYEKGDLAYLNKSADYPSCELTNEIRNILTKLMRARNANSLNNFFVYLLTSLTQEIQQGHASVADRILIQLLCHIQPNIIADNCDEVVHGKLRNIDSYLAVIWAMSQVTNNLKNGLAVWWSSMFSVLDKKHHAAASIHFFSRLMKNGGVAKDLEKPLLSPEQMLQLIELMVGEKSPLLHTPSLMLEMKGHLHRLTDLILNTKQQDQPKLAFMYVLPVLRNQDDSNVRSLACDFLVKCLLLHEECMEWWVDNFIHHMKESSVLLKYIQVSYEEINTKLSACRKYKSKPVLLDASKRIIENLDKANERGKFEKKAGFKDCRKVCAYFIRTEINRKKSSSRSWKMVKSLVMLLMLFFAFDVYRSGSYHESTTGQYLKRHGIESKVKDAFEHTQRLTSSVTGYCGEHFPRYYKKVSYYVDPVMQQSWDYISTAWSFIYTHSKPVREYLNEVVPPILEKVGYFFTEQYRMISGYLVLTFEKYSPIVHEHVTSAYNWLSVTVPYMYSNTVELVLTSKRRIYELNPEAFDSMYLALEDAWKYVIKMTPVVVDTVSKYTNQCVNATRSFVGQGQVWLQQQMPNGSN